MATTLNLHEHTWVQARAAFVEFYNQHAQRLRGGRGPRLEVIHGWGSTGVGGNVLGPRLRALLRRHPESLEFQPGEKFDGNEGHTFVVPIKSLPTDGDELAEKILDFCSNPKPSSAITNQFRRHGAPVVLESITKLEKSGELSPNIGAKGRRRLVAKKTATM